MTSLLFTGNNCELCCKPLNKSKNAKVNCPSSVYVENAPGLSLSKTALFIVIIGGIRYPYNTLNHLLIKSTVSIRKKCYLNTNKAVWKYGCC